MTGIDGLATLAGAFNAAALAAWIAVMAGLVRSLWHTFIAAPLRQSIPGDVA